MTDVPAFILKGVAVLNQLLQSEEDISKNGRHGNDHYNSCCFTPELLRRIKLGQIETTYEDCKIVDAISNRMESLHSDFIKCNSTASLVNQNMVKMWSLCGFAIYKQVWQRSRFRSAYTKAVKQCPHIISPHRMVHFEESINSSRLDQQLETVLTTLHSILRQYSTILSKITKLKQLEKTRIAYTESIFSILQQISNSSDEHFGEFTGLSYNNKVYSNLIEGVSLESFADGSIDVLHEELERLDNIIREMEEDAQLEELFWRWIGSPNGGKNYVDEISPKSDENKDQCRSVIDGSKIDLINESNLLTESTLLDAVNGVSNVALNNILQRVLIDMQSVLAEKHIEKAVDNKMNTRDKFESSYSVRPFMNQTLFKKGEFMSPERISEIEEELSCLRENNKDVLMSLLEENNKSKSSPFIGQRSPFDKS